MVTISKWIDIEKIEISKKEVCRNLGYISDYKLRPRISSLIDGYLENTYQLIEPIYSYVIRDVELVRRSCVFIDGSVMFESKVISSLLKPCNKAAMFVATIGNRLEEMSHKLAREGHMLQAAVLDAIGSVAVDEVAEFVHVRIKEIASSQGQVTSRRFSPGYCDWTIRQQKEVFRVVDAESAQVALTDSYLMIPQKSISGIIGIGTPDNNIENYNPCRRCKKLDCLGRR